MPSEETVNIIAATRGKRAGISRLKRTQEPSRGPGARTRDREPGTGGKRCQAKSLTQRGKGPGICETSGDPGPCAWMLTRARPAAYLKLYSQGN